MDDLTRQRLIDELDEKTASLILDHAQRQSQPEMTPRIAMAPRPTPPAPRPTPATPRQPAPRPPAPRLDRAALTAIGNVIAVVRREIEAAHKRELAELAQRADEHARQLAELTERINALEASRKRPSKIIDMTTMIGRGRAA